MRRAAMKGEITLQPKVQAHLPASIEDTCSRALAKGKMAEEPDGCQLGGELCSALYFLIAKLGNLH
jgi:hypothetical protein